jgi:hypothetical protein
MMCRVEADCTRDAVIGVVSELEFASGEIETSVLVMVPACEIHSTDAVHDTRASMPPEEFTVLSILEAAGDPGRLS